MTKQELQDWYQENLDEIIAMDASLGYSVNVIVTSFKIQSLSRLNQELDRRINPPVLTGRVDIETELMEVY